MINQDSSIINFPLTESPNARAWFRVQSEGEEDVMDEIES